MKANQKFLRGDDEGVSPVIAVILMVAITVVLAATVYVWVSGFGSNSNTSPAHTMSLASAGAVTFAATTVDHFYKQYTVSSADPTLTYGDIKLVIDGNEYALDGTNGCAQDSLATEEWGACGGTTSRTSTSAVTAGDTLTIRCDDTVDDADADVDCLSNSDFLILDVEANSVMVTLKVR